MSTTHTPTRRPRAPVRYRACLEGREPAEALTPSDRDLLVTELVEAGLTDVEIADRTCMSTYTTCRIRARLGLAVRPNTKEVAA